MSRCFDFFSFGTFSSLERAHGQSCAAGPFAPFFVFPGSFLKGASLSCSAKYRQLLLTACFAILGESFTALPNVAAARATGGWKRTMGGPNCGLLVAAICEVMPF